MLQNIELYDTTLRDGSQGEGISFSVDDKLAIAARLDSLGVHYIEGGWPGANPKDDEFFARIKEARLVHAVPVAFGSTRRQGSRHGCNHNRGQKLGPSCHQGAGDIAGREPAHDL